MAATLTQGGELTYLSFPITKTEETPEGHLYVYGKATDGSVDSDEQIIDTDFSSKAVREWLADGANVRVQHSPHLYPAGVGIEAHTDSEGATWVKSLIVEPTAKDLVKVGALRAYSVGIARPKIVRDSVARGGRIVDGQIIEISIVDRPANKNCGVQLVKSDGAGKAEWVGKVFGESGVLTKAEDTGSIDLEGTTVSVDLPKSASGTFSPADLAKLLEHRRVAEERATDKREFDPSVGGGVDRDKIPAEDFAGRDRSFPIVKPGDVSDAASSIGRAGPGNYSSDKLKANIIRIARRKGDAFVAELPDSWKSDSSEKSHDEPEVEKEKKPAFEGAAPAFDHQPVKKDDSPSQDDAEDDSDKPDDDDEPVAKKGMKDCPKCGKGFDADAKLRRCDKCDTKLPKASSKKSNKEAEVSKGEDTSCTGCGNGLDDDDKYCSNCGKKAPGGDMKSKSDDSVEKGKPTPGEGVVGSGASDIDPVPAHREPDGEAVESFEHDAGLPTDADNMSDPGGGVSEIPKNASMRLKSLGVPTEMGALHDLTCPVFHPATADKAYPGHSIAGIDTSFWQQKALDAAVSAPIDDARFAAQIWQTAIALKNADPVEISSLREEIHKSFTDANPGPGSFPTPGELSPKKFNRPYQTEGRARLSAAPSGTTHGTVPSGQTSAAEFDRGPLTSGHAEDSPSNKGMGAIIEPAPIPPGMSRTYYRNAERDAARSAMASMHDHIAQTFPDLCSMNGPGTEGNPPTGERPVPLPVGASKSEDEPVAKKSKKAGKKAVFKAASVVDADTIKSAVASVTAELAAQLAEVTKALKAERERTDKLQETIDALGDLPDPREAPFRGVAQNALTANKSLSGVPAGARTVAENAEQAQQAAIREMYSQWRNNPDPALREAAESYLFKMAGLPTANK